jgi:hypothetical protein
MQVIDFLTRPLPTVDNLTVAGLRNPFVSRQPGSSQQHSPNDFPVPIIEIIKRFDMLLGNHQEMHRRLRIDVFECDHLLVLIENTGLDFTSRDSTENAIFSAHVFLVSPHYTLPRSYTSCEDVRQVSRLSFVHSDTGLLNEHKTC